MKPTPAAHSFLFFGLCCWLALLPDRVRAGDNTSLTPAKISIIIDDLGNNLASGKRAIALPGPVTYAFLPHTPYATRLAQSAYQQGKEIMLHAPMSNQHGRALGSGALTQRLSRAEFIRSLCQSIQTIPHLHGVNNHMGSSLTREPLQMKWLMQELLQQKLYFVDSRTTADSVAWQVAELEQLPYAKRDIFLDHRKDSEAIAEQFHKLLEIARKRGYAIAIGHPYDETINYLSNVLPRLSAQQITLVPVSALIDTEAPAKPLKSLKEQPKLLPPVQHAWGQQTP